MKTFEDFANTALTIDTVRALVKAGNNVVMYKVMALAPYTNLQTVTVTPDVIDKFTPCDIGEQIGYLFNDGTTGRSYVSDEGLDPNHRYNRHLCFSTLEQANEYINFVKVDPSLIFEQKEIDEENAMFESMYSLTDYNYFDNY